MKSVICGVLLTASAIAQPVLVDSYYNIGTNGYDLFCLSVSNSDPAIVYLWEKSTNLLDPWVESAPPFIGQPVPIFFYDPVPHGSSNTFYRLLVVSPVARNVPFREFTNSLPITNWPPPPFPGE